MDLDLARYGYPECVTCERPAVVRVREWFNGGNYMGLCYVHYMEGEKNDPGGRPRPWHWIDGRGRK